MSVSRVLYLTCRRPYACARSLAGGRALYQGQFSFITIATEASSECPDAGTENSDAPSKGFLNEKIPQTPNLDALLGKEATDKAKILSNEIRILGLEVARLYYRQRILWPQLGYGRHVKSDENKDLNDADQAISVRDNKVFVADKHIPSIWLRDHCRCAECMHAATKQRLVNSFSIPADISIKDYSLDDSTLKIEWSDDHHSTYQRKALPATLNLESHKSYKRQGMVSFKLWDSSIASKPPRQVFPHSKGFQTPKATKKLLERIAFIRETHYGGFYDFTANLASKDTAYTNIALEAHTDTTYFSEPAGLQAFHLLSHTDGEGGASLLVDGFKVADELRRTDREAYRILSTVNVYAHASGNKDISIMPYRGFPVLEHDPVTGALLRVRWNSSDRAAIQLPIEQVETWYDAARKFDALIKKKENEYWEQLKPGRVLIFDNWRVLHGRSKFTGKRRICGGYINRDDWMSKYKMLRFEEAVID